MRAQHAVDRRAIDDFTERDRRRRLEAGRRRALRVGAKRFPTRGRRDRHPRRAARAATLHRPPNRCPPPSVTRPSASHHATSALGTTMRLIVIARRQLGRTLVRLAKLGDDDEVFVLLVERLALQLELLLRRDDGRDLALELVGIGERIDLRVGDANLLRRDGADQLRAQLRELIRARARCTSLDCGIDGGHFGAARSHERALGGGEILVESGQLRRRVVRSGLRGVERSIAPPRRLLLLERIDRRDLLRELAGKLRALGLQLGQLRRRSNDLGELLLKLVRVWSEDCAHAEAGATTRTQVSQTRLSTALLDSTPCATSKWL